MRSFPDCVPCWFRQALSTARRVTDDEDAQRGALLEMARRLGEFDLSETPAEISYYALIAVQRYLGADDPYREEKHLYNAKVLELEDRLQEMIDTNGDRLHTAVKLAAAGNIIDLGIVSEFNLDDHIRSALNTGFAVDDYELLCERLARAGSVLYVLDNAGEIVFDKLLIRQLSDCHVTAVVRTSPILNDVTMEDAMQVGLDKVCEVVDTGCDVFGVPLGSVSEEFRRRFDAADVVIAKGQANFETLDGCGREVFFVLKAKCPSIAAHLGVNLHDSVLMMGT